MQENLKKLAASKYFLSIIVSFYNNANSDFAENLINKLLELPSDIEVVCVDDGSTDNTLEVLNRYADRFKVVSRENGRPFLAYNSGFKVASGFYVHAIDCDDILDFSLYSDLKDLIKQGIAPDLFAFPRRFIYADKNKTKLIPLKIKKNTVINVTQKNFRKYFVPYNNRKLDGYRWNKIYKTEYIQYLINTFPHIYNHKIVFCSDNFQTYPVFQMCKHFYILDKSYYDYFYYSGSTCHKNSYFTNFVVEEEFIFNSLSEIVDHLKVKNEVIRFRSLSYVMVYGLLLNLKEKEAFKRLKQQPFFKKELKKYLFKHYFYFWLPLVLHLNFVFKLAFH